MTAPYTKPGEVIDLRPLGRALGDAKTRAIVKTPAFEAIRLIVRAGTEIPAHQTTGSITLHCIEGRVQLGLPEAMVELSAGEWCYLEGSERHSVKGIEDSGLLLTILFGR